MKRIAITGNIGSGKTWVSNLFEDHFDIPVFDSDLMVKGLYFRFDIRDRLCIRFGKDLYQPGPGINKARLAEIIFNDPEALAFVENLVYPSLFHHYDFWANDYAIDKPYVLFESALVFEKHLEDRFDGIIMVTASEATRLRRVMERNGCSEAEVRQRMALQWTEADKCAKADFVVDHETDDDDEGLLSQVRRIHETLCR